MTGASVQRRLPALLRDPGPFRFLFWGQALSVLGDRVVPIAIAFGVLGIGSTTDLGLVLAAGGIPFALFAIVGGVLSDRLGRRNVMIAADLLRVVVQAATATLLITGAAQVWMLAALVVRLRALGRLLHAGVHGADPAGRPAGAACRRPTPSSR